MPKSMQERYPTRSKLRIQEGIYDCAPVLDYDVFVDGDVESQLREYVRGISLSAPYIAALGATPQQIEEFNAILEGAIDRIMIEESDQTRH